MSSNQPNAFGLTERDMQALMDIFQKYPEIAAIKERLYDLGALYAALSGSGSAVFGLFEGSPERSQWPEGHFVFEGIML